MSRKLIPCLAVLVVLGGVAAHAEGLEITLFGGYAVGGEFEGELFDSELESSSTYGLIIDIPVASDLQLEIFASQQGTDLVVEGFGPGGLGPLAEVDVQYLHIGILQHFDHGNVEPYYVFSAGLTQLNPTGYETESRPSVGFGGGTKLFLSRDALLGFRFGGRILATYFDDPEVFCNSGGCLGEVSGTFMVQAQAEIGLVIRF
jgi:hypothetical protein